MHTTKTVSFALLQEIDKAVASIDLTIKDKLVYAIETHLAPSIAKAFQKVQDRFNEERNDLMVEHCYTDERGIIQRDEKGNYQFNKEGQKAFNKAMKDLKDESETWPCEVKVHLVKQWSPLRKGDKAILEEVKTTLLGILFGPESGPEKEVEPEAEKELVELGLSENGKH